MWRFLEFVTLNCFKFTFQILIFALSDLKSISLIFDSALKFVFFPELVRYHHRTQVISPTASRGHCPKNMNGTTALITSYLGKESQWRLKPSLWFAKKNPINHTAIFLSYSQVSASFNWSDITWTLYTAPPQSFFSEYDVDGNFKGMYAIIPPYFDENTTTQYIGRFYNSPSNKSSDFYFYLSP